MSAQTHNDTTRAQLDIEKIRAEITTLLDSSRKMQAEVLKMKTETRWHPFWVTAALIGAGAALAKMFTS